MLKNVESINTPIIKYVCYKAMLKYPRFFTLIR